MSLLLLDTTLLIDVERTSAELDLLIADDDDTAIAAVTVAELTVGVHLASPRQQQRRRAYVDQIVASVPVLSYDMRVAIEHAELLVAVRSAGRPRGAHDLIIAATARAYGRTVASADRTAFVDLPGVTAVDHRS